MLIRTFTPAPDAKATIVPEWITESGFTEEIRGRTKVGRGQGTSRIGLITTATGAMSWLPMAPGDYKGEGEPRPVNAGWNDAGTMGFVFTTSSDNKEWWLWSVDPANGDVTLLDHLHDDAWVGGPCFARCVGFVPGTERIWYVSEATGYAQLYSVNADGTDRKRSPAVTGRCWA